VTNSIQFFLVVPGSWQTQYSFLIKHAQLMAQGVTISEWLWYLSCRKSGNATVDVSRKLTSSAPVDTLCLFLEQQEINTLHSTNSFGFFDRTLSWASTSSIRMLWREDGHLLICNIIFHTVAPSGMTALQLLSQSFSYWSNQTGKQGLIGTSEYMLGKAYLLPEKRSTYCYQGG